MSDASKNNQEIRKRFIEYDLPLAEISEYSAKEKSIRHGHPSTLHIWWARRPLAASRATAFAALIDLPDEDEKREEIKELIKKITPWDAVKNGNSKDIEKARQMILKQWGRPPKVLDPFAGGGSISLETLRLGCETYASDLNPVAVFIEKATLEWPQKFGVEIPNPERNGQQSFDGPKKVNFLVYMVEKWAKKVLEEAKKEISIFYPEDEDGWVPVGYIWARTIPCQNPSCGGEIPLIRQYWLIKKGNRKVAYKPVIDKGNKKINFVIQEDDEIDFDPLDGTVKRGKTKCLLCGNVIGREVMKLAQEGKMSEKLIAVVLHHPKYQGKKYRNATSNDIETFNKAKNYLQEKIKKWKWLDSPLPEEKIFHDKIEDIPQWLWVSKYGYPRWQDIFNSRQKLSLVTFMDKIKESFDGITEECHSLEIEKHGLNPNESSKAIMGYLGILMGRLVDYISSLCVWEVTGEFIAHTFGRQALGMTWDYFELNPLSGSTGDWSGSINWVSHFIKANSWRTSSKSVIKNLSAMSLSYPDLYFDAVITDPPYYDNVPYADLSDFFYVWLKRCVGDIFPDIFFTSLAPRDDEIVADFVRHGGIEKAKVFFEKSLSHSFREIYKVLRPGGITVIVYAHKTTSGWETMLNSLVNAGLVVTASWPINTERRGRLREHASAALASSIYMVCRKIDREPVGYFSEIKPKIKKRIEEKLQQFWNEGIAGGDFFISAIGPAMETFSKYEMVEKYSGETVTISELLDYIRSVVTDWIVNKLLKDASSGAVDKESHFYLTYRWTYLNNTVPFDDARKLASASGVDLEKLWNKGFVKKTGSNIKVLGPKEREKLEKINNMVDVMHKSILLWEKGKKDDLNQFLSETGYGSNPAFWQYCQAIAETLINGKEKQLLEGFLMGRENYMHKDKKKQKGLEDFS